MKRDREFLNRLLDIIRDSDGWKYDTTTIDNAKFSLTVFDTGEIYFWGVGRFPFDWSERRSIARAFKRRHAAMLAEIVAAVREALKAKGGGK